MNNTLAAIDLLLRLMNQASSINALIQKSRAEGRDISDEELDSLVDADDAARIELEHAIAEAKAQGK